MSERIKSTIIGSAETMLQSFYARTVVLDELVKNFIEKNPDCTVVNIACGLDTRFYHDFVLFRNRQQPLYSEKNCS